MRMMRESDVADVVIIQQLLAITANAIDGILPPEILGECFTADARMDVLLADGTLIDRAEGHEALFAFCRRISAPNNTRRWGLNPVVEIDGDTAKIRTHSAVVSIEPPSRTILRTSIAVNTLVRTNDGWRISEQIVTLDPSVILPPVSGI